MNYSSVDEIISAVDDLTQRYPFLISCQIEERTTSILKLKIIFNPGLYIQLYANTRRPKISFALVFNSQRLYGKDFYMDKWHRHPFEAPETHDISPEGSRATTVERFFLEVIQYLEAAEMI